MAPFLTGIMTIREDTIKACLKGKRSAQHELYRQVFPYLMGICIRYYRNELDARSALNASFLKILNNIDKYEYGMPFKPWIKRITVNTIIDIHRKNRKAEIVELNEQLIPDDLKTVDVDEKQESMPFEEVQAMIEELSPMSQQVINLYAIDGYRHKEIAEILGISESTSKWHLFNARKKLKRALEAKAKGIKKNIYG